MKKSALMLAMLASAGIAFSLPVEPEQTAKIAQQHWLQMGGKSDVILVDRSAEWPYSTIRLYAAPAGGFVMVAADDVARPVLGYSLTQPINPAELPVQLEDWLADYQREIEWAVQEGLTSSDEWHSTGWKSGGYTAVEPLMETRWDQGDPYNLYTPGRTPVGCAATAQAQVMKFWNYPAFGFGNHTYDCPNYGMQSADFAHQIYQWDLMPNRPNSAVSQNVRVALSTLLYHIGVSLDMRYNPSGSGTLGFAGFPGTTSNDNSLIDYFYYKNTLEVKNKANFTDEDWRDMLIEELKFRRPILYMGTDPAGGHAFVCDGNDTNGYLHFNFGWSGTGDGYYAIGAINPGIGSRGRTGDYRFNSNNMAIIKLEPDYGIHVSDTSLSFMRGAATDSILFAVNDTLSDTWTISADADWVSIEYETFARAGWIKLSCTENNSGTERIAHVTFVQGIDSKTISIIQSALNPDDFCTLTVEMESTRGNGWQNSAYLSLESPTGFVYGTATLTSGTSGTQQIAVPDGEVLSVWHTGGGTDRYINYRVLNPNGIPLVEVEYAYMNGGTHTLNEPCTHVGISPAEEHPFDITVHRGAVEVSGIEGLPVALYSVDGRLVSMLNSASDRATIAVPATGVYILKVGQTVAQKVVVIQ